MAGIQGLPAVEGSGWRQLAWVRRDFFSYLQHAATLGPLVQLKPAPGVRIVLVNSAELCAEILKRDAASYRKSDMTRRMVSKFLGQGLVLSEGSQHLRERALIQPIFRPGSVQRFLPILGLTARNRLRQWPQDTPIDVGLEMGGLSLSALLLTLFDMHDGDDAFGVHEAMRRFAASIGSRFERIPWPNWLPTPGNLRDRQAIRTVDRSLQAVVQARRHMSPGSDLIARLIGARDHQGALTDGQLRDHLATLYFAGHETTARALTWAIAVLVRYPEWQQRLFQELWDNGGARGPTAPELLALPMMDHFLRELLRLYPPAWLFDRQSVVPTCLDGVELPAGTVFYLSPWLLHRNPDVFEDPERFDPDRHARTGPLPAFSYLPFGGGARQCIGQHYALAMLKVVLAQLLLTHELRHETAAMPDFKATATLAPAQAVEIRVRRRPQGSGT